MKKKNVISGPYFREHPFCIKSGTHVEIIDHLGDKRLDGKRLYFDGYDTFGRRKVNDIFDLFPVFKEEAKNGGINKNKSFFIDAYGFTGGYYDLKIIDQE